MYIGIYVYIYIYRHIYTYTSKYIYIPLHAHMNVCECTYFNIEVWKYKCAHVQNNHSQSKLCSPQQTNKRIRGFTLSRAGGEVRIIGVYNNKQTNKQRNVFGIPIISFQQKTLLSNKQTKPDPIKKYDNDHPLSPMIGSHETHTFARYTTANPGNPLNICTHCDHLPHQPTGTYPPTPPSPLLRPTCPTRVRGNTPQRTRKQKWRAILNHPGTKDPREIVITEHHPGRVPFGNTPSYVTRSGWDFNTIQAPFKKDKNGNPTLGT